MASACAGCGGKARGPEETLDEFLRMQNQSYGEPLMIRFVPNEKSVVWLEDTTRLEGTGVQSMSNTAA